MADIYVNLHPTYTYSNVIIGEGYIDNLKEYVNLVDCLNWDWFSLKGKPLIRVSGGFGSDENSIEKHLERTKVLLQRIVEHGNHNIFIRNSRGEEWTRYVPEQTYTEQRMYEIEVQRIKEPDNERWVREDIKKYQAMLENVEADWIKQVLNEKIEKSNELEEKEILRKNNLKGVWNDENDKTDS